MRRSEEPLVRIQKPVVDETVVEEDDVSLQKEKNNQVLEKDNVVLKENVVKAIFDGVKSKEAAMGSSNKEVEVVDLGESDEEMVEKVVNKEVKVKKVRVDLKNIKDVEKEIERERLERVEREAREEELLDEKEEDEEEVDYEVEEILEYAFCKVDQVGKYFVKWVGWSSDTNTWEPEANLECTDLLVNFYKTRLKERESMTPAEKRAHELPPDPRETFQVRLDFLKENCPVPSKREVEAMFRRDRRLPKDKRAKALPEKILNAHIDAVAKSGAKNQQKIDYIKEQVRIREMVRLRTDQLNELAKYEKEINQIDSASAHVQVVNDVDLEGPPRQMQYINAYRAAEGITIPNDPPIGCECTSCGLEQDSRSDSEGCCPSAMGNFKFAYTKHSKLRIGVGNPIYECNKLCLCKKTCVNRVVQNGRKHKLAIYRTSNGCGWGVKALETIKTGSFVVEYVGEMITSEEAEERGKKYDAEGRTYLFDLDFNRGDQNLYTVDAAFYGNLSHFINHSCDPNLNIFNVYVDCLDPDMPRLCLFAKREIKRGEQISFDYCQSTSNPNKDADEGILASPSNRATNSSTKHTRNE